MTDSFIDRARLFGNDLLLVQRNQDTTDLTPNDLGDLAVVHGNETIVQTLTMRLMVKRGELAPLGWPDYGSRLYELIGELNIPRTHQKIMAFARQAIEEDPRVAEVTAMQVTAESNIAHLLMEITLIDSPNPVNLVYDVNLVVR